MILNQKVIENKILKRSLIEQIVSIRSKAKLIPFYCQQINLLTNKIQSQQILLEKTKNALQIRKQKINEKKQHLLKQLQNKKAQLKSQQQNASNQMRKLNFCCSSIRNNRQQLKSQIKVQQQIKNQLEQIYIHIQESEQDILAYQFLSIEDKKHQKDLLQQIKQKNILIDDQKLQKQKYSNLSGILSQHLIELENKIAILNFQKSKLQISHALILSELEKVQIQVKNLSDEQKVKKLKVFELQSVIMNNQTKIQTQQKTEANNQQKQIQLKDSIERSISQGKKINQMLIKARQSVISLNVAKNQQKKTNQKLRLKIKQLMKTTLQMTKDSPEL